MQHGLGAIQSNCKVNAMHKANTVHSSQILSPYRVRHGSQPKRKLKDIADWFAPQCCRFPSRLTLKWDIQPCCLFIQQLKGLQTNNKWGLMLSLYMALQGLACWSLVYSQSLLVLSCKHSYDKQEHGQCKPLMLFSSVLRINRQSFSQSAPTLQPAQVNMPHHK